ncbi:hypothetical protein [Salinirubrum litoreum]|uniref:Peptidase family M28 n=1 Tax=Salinirubrum litoreum TaxID=1126234 RepID=A0ABD5RGR7_9EURY|nr:hypothetical protein [Salinirubrum litoreum]
MNREAMFEAVDRAFDPERARETAVEMTQYYRAPGTSGFHAAMEYVERALTDAGLDVSVDRPTMTDAWEPNDARLSVVAPEATTLIDYETAPACIAWASSATDGPEQFEVVDVGTGEHATDFEGKDLDGKVAFVHGTERRPGWWEAARNAVDAGARGIITDYMLYQTPGVREPELVPEAAQLLRLRPPEAFVNEDVWAFSIPHAAAETLDGYLADGPVTVEADVDVDVFDSDLPYVEATIPGSEKPDETILFCGHASGIKPGANCAEGTGLVVELARALESLVEDGEFEPKRSLTFILGGEGPVSEHYLDTHPDAAADVVTTLTYCSTGHKQHETESTLLLSSSPDSVRHYTNDYLAELAELSPKDADWIGKEGGKELPLVSLTQHYYTPWSDNTRFAALGIPAPLFMSWPDRCFHSQLLTKDVIDPRALRRSALISGVAGLELATADDRTAESIARIVAGRATDRLRRLGSRYATGESDDRARRHIEYVGERDVEALQTAAELADGDVSERLDRLAESVEETASQEVDSLEAPDQPDRDPAAQRVPVRTVEGGDALVDRWTGLAYDDLLAVADELHEDDPEAGWRSLRVVSDEAWNFVDGERTVGEIADAVGFEFGLRVDPGPIETILEGHAEGGNLRFE